MESFEIRLTNLSFAAKAQDIKDFVSTFAKVKEIKLVLDHQKRSKGFFF
jgi:RNA recognition motif-containing protein